MTHAEASTSTSVDFLSVPASFPEILRDLNREVVRNQPRDIYQFCANYFLGKLESQRAKLIGMVPGQSYSSGPATALNDSDLARLSSSEDMETDPPSSSLSVAKKHRLSSASAVHRFMVTTAAEQGQAVEEQEEEEEDEDDDDDDEEDDVAAAMPPPIAHNRGRRTSVSAESMAPSEDRDYVKVVIPKTEEQRARIQASIKNNFLFKSCDEEQYTDVVNAMAEKRVTAGEEVIRQGGVGDYFYVVETGALEVFVSRNGNPPVKVYDYGAGGAFGELALMYNAPRAATVIATEESVLWALDRVTFRRILMENTNKKRRMYESFLEEVPLLVSLEPYERHKIADALESVVFNDGDVVIRQGDVGDNFYIIESGEASVTTTDPNGVEHSMKGLKKGDYFGELALLTNEPRRATITAKGRLKLATLGKKAFVRLLGPVVDIIKRNANSYEKPAPKP